MFLDKLTEWLVALWNATFVALWQFVQDAAIALASAFLTALAALIAAIPVPDFATGGMQSVLGAIPAATAYLLVACGLPSALAIYGAGWAFRLARKLVTLFQW